jgi:hypothetical protein
MLKWRYCFFLLYLIIIICWSRSFIFDCVTTLKNVVRKVERQYLDIAPSASESLRINGTAVDSYLRNFTWDGARYQHQGRQLTEIVTQVLTMANKVDEELKRLTLTYNEKHVTLTNLQRKKIINLATSDFEDFISPERAARLEVYQAGSDGIIETVFLVMPKAVESGKYGFCFNVG